MKKLIIANWKLNPATLEDARDLAASISIKAKNKVVLCVPTVYLSNIQYPNLGAQDCFWESSGAFTGQTSALQLKSLKIKYCIVGHSERRAVGDTDEMINLKLKTLISHGLTPVLCVGFGTKVEQDDLEVVDVLKSQLDTDLAGVDANKVIVAYEPVWAIGTGKNATPEHAEKIAIFIKSKYGVLKVLYGGSTNANNSKSFLDQPNIDGLLVGGASLIASQFNQIINY
ncbi:MAG: triose-phosphate isomerase [Candidatus Doudnabacteria bacterium]|nr:triose-phosphate isomerase [Candidatus Doudnabacteria bacterium]